MWVDLRQRQRVRALDVHRAATKRVNVRDRHPSADTAVSERKPGCSGEIRKDEFCLVHCGAVAAGCREPAALNVVLGKLKRGQGPRVDFGVNGVDKVIEGGTIGY